MSQPSQTVPDPPPILLVDDDQQQLDLYGEILSPYFQVSTASSTREALLLLQARIFKVIVCDYSMPGGDGLSFLVTAGEKYPSTQRIFVTGYMKPDILRRKLDETALFRYLLKPVSLPELIKTVQDAVKQYDQAAVKG
jgi:two-component system response regulator HupR/HoxA